MSEHQIFEDLDFIHGADYYPEQWLDRPDILEADIKLMKKANCNTIRVGIFAWTALEPEEGRFDFSWLDQVIEKLAQNDIKVILATPSGARPAWLAEKYPEVLRVNEDRKRILFGERHNHCYTSPIYRKKTKIINKKMSERYGDHPAVILWHISNEYGGECHCDLCQEAFRKWLQKKYGSLDKLNKAWWTSFWNHTFTDWSQIDSPAPHGLKSNHGLNLDWKRFVTYQTRDFYRNEVKAVREFSTKPVTTNFMYKYAGLNYREFASDVDIISWDSYPAWHGKEIDQDRAVDVAFMHNVYRSMKNGQPFLLMESTPSMTNWQPVAKLKRPKMHQLSSIQAVAHGSDSVQYFQWRKSRGGFEKFHGAVVDHTGTENTRVFEDVAELGENLKKFKPIMGSGIEAEVAIVFDWENLWAINDAAGPRKEKKDYIETCIRHYQQFWQRGVAVDIIDMKQDFSQYELLVTPMLYMLRDGVAERIEEFVQQGGTLVSTYWSGIVNENDLCFLGGFPGPLKEVMGIWAEEIDALYEEDSNQIVMDSKSDLEIKGEYQARIFCELIHLNTARALAHYQEDFYQGKPALTVNEYGKGKAFYIASRNEDSFLVDFYNQLIDKLDIKTALKSQLPAGVTAITRTNGNNDYIFVMNFNDTEQEIILGKSYSCLISEEIVTEKLKLEPYGVEVIRQID